MNLWQLLQFYSLWLYEWECILASTRILMHNQPICYKICIVYLKFYISYFFCSNFLKWLYWSSIVLSLNAQFFHDPTEHIGKIDTYLLLLFTNIVYTLSRKSIQSAFIYLVLPDVLCINSLFYWYFGCTVLEAKNAVILKT